MSEDALFLRYEVNGEEQKPLAVDNFRQAVIAAAQLARARRAAGFMVVDAEGKTAVDMGEFVVALENALGKWG